VTPQKQVIGFRRSFQVRTPGKELLLPIFTRENSSVDSMRLIKHLCTTSISKEDFINISDNFNEMCEIQKSKGRVDNVVMDALNICKLPDGDFKNRDALCLAQQGPVDITHRETRLREEAYAKRMETANKDKQLADAHALVASEALKKQKLEVASAEKMRVQALTNEQKLVDPICIASALKRKAAKDNAKLRKDEKILKENAARIAAHELIASNS